MDFKAGTNLIEFQKEIVKHFRVVLEKVKALGEEKEVEEKIKGMSDETFYEFIKEESDKNNI